MRTNRMAENLTCRRTTHRRCGVIARGAALLALLSAVAAAWGQTATSKPVDRSALPARQQAIRDRLERLEERMLRLAQLLRETEPDKSEKLRDAVELSGRERLRARISELVTLLSAAQFSDAERRQEELIGDLESVLRLLTSSLNDLDRRRQERERLEALRRSIRGVMEEQSANLYRTQGAISAAELEAELRVMTERLTRLAEEQAAQAADTQSPVAERGERQAKSESAAREAAESLRKLSAGQSENEERSAGSALGEAADSVDAAIEQMQQAREKLAGGAAEQAAQAQTQAEEALRRAAERLAQEQEKQQQRRDAREIEQAERQTAEKTGQIERSMSEQGAESSASPGARQVGRAREHMQRAADRLGEQNPQDSAPAQSAALDELQSAMNELDDALRQIRREETEETLTALEARFRSMLAKEEHIYSVVTDLDAKGAAAWQRTDRLQLAAAVVDQRAVVEDCDTVLRIVTTEGTTVVVPEIVRQLAADMRVVAERLDAGDSSAATRRVLGDIIDVLKELLAAVERKREENSQSESQQGNPSGEQDPSEPLLPGSAELKLLKSGQMRIIRQTEDLRQQIPAAAAVAEPPASDAAAPEELRRRFAELSARQKVLSELTRKMHERK
ncbi:MAG: hypothetical protein CHACPFDD_00796 [Phycisphaerae bacterium]|nr:hypothetical protein [Phycisphaerae bacterium]